MSLTKHFVAKATLPKALLLVFFAMQCLMWFAQNRIKPSFIITPYPPTARQIQAFSFGDTQFYFRKLAFELQNAGDKYGHLTSLKDYDYKRLVRWFKALDGLDENSNYIPYMAAYYYSLVQDSQKTLIIADYILDFASQNPYKHWRLLTIAGSLYYKDDKPQSYTKLQQIGEMLASTKDIPMWARVISAFYLKKSNHICDAYRLIIQISKDDLLTEKENAPDEFLAEILNANIEKLQNAGKTQLMQCAKSV